MAREPGVLTSVVATLRRDIGAQRIEADSAQMAAAVCLDELSLALRKVSVTRQALRSFGVSLFGRQASTPRGIYLCGGVGRGKTYLMDLFYATLDFPQRERTMVAVVKYQAILEADDVEHIARKSDRQREHLIHVAAT